MRARRIKISFGFLLFALHVGYRPINSGALQLDGSNIDSVLASNEFVFINFYADWCRFSNMLAPVWDEVADKVKKEYPGVGKAVVGKLDCDSNSELGSRFRISKYPTLKYAVNGEMAKKEYRGGRSVDAMVDFVRKQVRYPIEEFGDVALVASLDNNTSHFIGYFEEKETVEFANFKKASARLKDECLFHAGFGDVVKGMHPSGESVVTFRPKLPSMKEDGETFTGSLAMYDEFYSWAESRCIPLVREITFDNAEELTEEGLPFLILFRQPGDDESVNMYVKVIEEELQSYRGMLSFLFADGVKFSHPLHHLGKSTADLPVVALDSFRHMYLLDKYQDMLEKGKLHQFVVNFFSGKLHREYHYGPDDETTSEETEDPVGEGKTEAPPSQFQHLGPSKNRYTFLHDEF